VARQHAADASPRRQSGDEQHGHERGGDNVCVDVAIEQRQLGDPCAVEIFTPTYVGADPHQLVGGEQQDRVDAAYAALGPAHGGGFVQDVVAGRLDEAGVVPAHVVAKGAADQVGVVGRLDLAGGDRGPVVSDRGHY
jgi:hypothetical protein